MGIFIAGIAVQTTAYARQGGSGGATFKQPGVVVTGISGSGTYYHMKQAADGWNAVFQLTGDPILKAVLSKDHAVISCRQINGQLPRKGAGIQSGTMKGAVQVVYSTVDSAKGTQSVQFNSESVLYQNLRSGDTAGSGLTFPSPIKVKGSDGGNQSQFSLSADKGSAVLGEAKAGAGQTLQDLSLTGSVVMDYTQAAVKPGTEGNHYHCTSERAHIARKPLSSGKFQYVIDVLGHVNITGSNEGTPFDWTNGQGWEVTLDDAYRVISIDALSSDTTGTVEISGSSGGGGSKKH